MPAALVADPFTEVTYLLQLHADSHTVRRVAPDALSEHAGVLALPRTAPDRQRLAYVDNAGGALVTVDDTGVTRRIPVAVPGEHLSCDDTGRYVVVTTGVGLSPEPWSDVLTVADLATGRSRQVRTHVDEPGVVVTGSGLAATVLLRHRSPGSIESFSLAALLDAPSGSPQVQGSCTAMRAGDGHGDAWDPRRAHLWTATGAGLESFTLDGAIPQVGEVAPWPTAGRAFFMRAQVDRRRLVMLLRGGPADPTRWPQWRNWLATFSLDAAPGSDPWCIQPLPDGLSFRPDVGGDLVAAAVIHPDGDSLLRWDLASDQLQFTPLPALAAGPVAGATPWDGSADRPAQRRAVAQLGRSTLVTQSGEGAILRVDTDDNVVEIPMPTPLHEGGHLARLSVSDEDDHPDRVGR